MAITAPASGGEAPTAERYDKDVLHHELPCKTDMHLMYSVCIPVDTFPLLIFHAMSEAATMTAPTITKMTTVTITAPMIASDTCVEGPPPTVAGVKWDDGSSLLLSVVDDSPAAGRPEDATLLDEMLLSSVTGVAATYVHTYIHTYKHTYIHTDIYSYIHTNTCIHTYIHT